MKDKNLDKIELITRRIEEIELLIGKEIARGNTDLRLLKHSLMINQRILFLMKNGLDVTFYKISDSYQTLDPSGFFLSTTEITNPFTSILN